MTEGVVWGVIITRGGSLRINDPSQVATGALLDLLLRSLLLHFRNIFQLLLGIFAVTPSRKGEVASRLAEGQFQ